MSPVLDSTDLIVVPTTAFVWTRLRISTSDTVGAQSDWTTSPRAFLTTLNIADLEPLFELGKHSCNSSRKRNRQLWIFTIVSCLSICSCSFQKSLQRQFSSRHRDEQLPPDLACRTWRHLNDGLLQRLWLVVCRAEVTLGDSTSHVFVNLRNSLPSHYPSISIWTVFLLAETASSGKVVSTNVSFCLRQQWFGVAHASDHWAPRPGRTLRHVWRARCR